MTSCKLTVHQLFLEKANDAIGSVSQYYTVTELCLHHAAISERHHPHDASSGEI